MRLSSTLLERLTDFFYGGLVNWVQNRICFSWSVSFPLNLCTSVFHNPWVDFFPGGFLYKQIGLRISKVVKEKVNFSSHLFISMTRSLPKAFLDFLTCFFCHKAYISNYTLHIHLYYNALIVSSHCFWIVIHTDHVLLFGSWERRKYSIFSYWVPPVCYVVKCYVFDW